MNYRKMVKISNVIGFVSALALIYWIVIFTTLHVFGLRVFNEHTIAIFDYSIFGIMALMFGTFMMNIMLNLSRIVEGDKNKELPKKGKKIISLFLLSIPCIIVFLFLGNFISEKQMESNLKKSADEIIKSYSQEINKMSNYSFTREWINETAGTLQIMERIDKNFDYVFLITADEIRKNSIYLTFSGDAVDRKTQLNKIDYINKSTLKERKYLDKVMHKDRMNKYFVSKDRDYKLFVPFKNGSKKVIFIFTNRQHYETLGS
ncbi:MAG: hypothetical protein LBH90_05265 [Tannerella sp.]|nr:hypothetical protein [Tannerella sp.]